MEVGAKESPIFTAPRVLQDRNEDKELSKRKKKR